MPTPPESSGMAGHEHDVVLSAEGLKKTSRAGEIHGIAGVNGAEEVAAAE